MKKIFLLLIILGSFFACSDERLAELNRPKKNASAVTGETLFANGLKNMVDLMASTDVNSNVFRLYAQYWAQTTYPDESQYNMVGREIPDNFFTLAYRDALMDLHEASRVIEATWQERGLDEEVKNNQLAQINICKVYMYSVLVDLFGAIPYDEALNPEILIPKYQSGEEVYGKIIDLLDASIASLDQDFGGFGPTQDLLYNDNTSGWYKFANSLKLRLAMNIADVNPSKASAMVGAIVASSATPTTLDDVLIVDNHFELGLESSANATLAFEAETPNTNPIWEDLVQSGRADYVVANTLVDIMNASGDPRLPIYAEARDGEFIGGEYGTANTYSANSPAGTLFHEPDLEGVIFDAAETNFLLAEAAARGFAVPLTAMEYYNQGIAESMEYWSTVSGQPISDVEIAAYIAANSYNPADWKQSIGIQEWIALYNRGYEGWTAWRRLDFTGFNVPDGLTESDIPRRFIFPIEEATLNPSNLDAAIGLIGGSDDVQTKVFWDVN